MSDPIPDRPAPVERRLPVVRRRPSAAPTPTPPSTLPSVPPDHAPITDATAPAPAPITVARRRPASEQQTAIDRPPVVARRPVPPATYQPSPPEPAAATPPSTGVRQQPPNPHSPYVRRQFVAEAHRFRAEHRIAVADGLLTVHDVVEIAREPRGKPLLRITRSELLTERRGCGPRRAREALQRLPMILDLEAVPARTTIAWLIDSRVNGARLLAWLDAVETTELLPEGFPFGDADGTAS